MSDVQAALYARVSTEQQAEVAPIASQLAALRERAKTDRVALPATQQFVDEGYSGASLVRPGLERLRDQIAAGDVDRLYVHSPDRLARKYAYQVLLIDEFRRAGVDVVFLNHALGKSPEDDLLLQVQGMMAEYERAKIMERCRRGKRHAAHAGSVNIMSCAPYGYRIIGKREGGGRARFEVIEAEAAIVRQMFDWIGRERLTIAEVSRRLGESGERTRKGNSKWDRATVWTMLKNPAYKGEAAFGKSRTIAMQPRLRPIRGKSDQPRKTVSTEKVPREDWILIPIPALIDEELFEAVQAQLLENKKSARQRRAGASYLLQGLACCKSCGYAYCGKLTTGNLAQGRRRYVYYRCSGTAIGRYGEHGKCKNRQVRADLLDEAVWWEVCCLLQNPGRLEQEYGRRLHAPDKSPGREAQITAERQLAKLRLGTERLIDSYAEGVLEKREFEPRLKQLRERITKLEGQLAQIVDDDAERRTLQLIVGRLAEFAERVAEGLDGADWDGRRKLIRALVKRVDIDGGKVDVVFRVTPGPFEPTPSRSFSQDCCRGDVTRQGIAAHAQPGTGEEAIEALAHAGGLGARPHLDLPGGCQHASALNRWATLSRSSPSTR
jgi:site-specific DNA recombinase